MIDAGSGPGADDWVRVGRFGKPHGLRGLIKLHSDCGDEMDIANYCPLRTRPGNREITLSISHRTSTGLVARVEGVRSRQDARALKGETLYADRAAFPETEDDEYYHVDLMGLSVLDADGTQVGRIKTVGEFGGGAIVEVELTDGATVALPFSEDLVPEVNIAGGYVRAHIDPELSGRT